MAVKINIIINILEKTQKAKEPLVENKFSQYISVVYNQLSFPKNKNVKIDKNNFNINYKISNYLSIPIYHGNLIYLLYNNSQ